MRIDWWTLALQTVNVLILIWILGRFFFRPIMDMVTKRQEAANKLLADADHARQEAAEARAAADRAGAEIATEREALLAQARDAAQIEKQRLLAQASQELAKLHSDAEAAIARERAAAEEAIIDHATELAVEIARRLLARVPGRDILHAFLDEICRELRKLSPEARESLAFAPAADHRLEVVTAAPLSGEEMQQVGERLNEAFGLDLALAFRSDPAIIAGLEVHGRNGAIRDSWRADLDHIRHELSHDRNPRKP